MLERAISGTVFVAIMLAAIWFGPYTLWAFMAVVALGCLWEYQKLLFDVQDSRFQVRRWVQLVVMGAWLAGWFTYLAGIQMKPMGTYINKVVYGSAIPPILFHTLVAIFWLYIILELFLKHVEPFKQIAVWIFGFWYAVFPVCLYTLLHFNNDGVYEPMRALAPFLLIWTNDTMAYLCGRAVGRTPFFPRISPKKTWEGTIGGAICTIALAAALGAKMGGFTPKQWILAAFIISIFGSIGDLVESMLKRSVGVKDSGSIMPGHGGFLDRFDSFIFAAPFLWLAFSVLELFR